MPLWAQLARSSGGVSAQASLTIGSHRGGARRHLRVSRRRSGRRFATCVAKDYSTPSWSGHSSCDASSTPRSSDLGLAQAITAAGFIEASSVLRLEEAPAGDTRLWRSG